MSLTRDAVLAPPGSGRDQPFWVPSLDQALAMARASGRPIFLMGYSQVADRDRHDTYHKLGDDYLTNVF